MQLSRAITAPAHDLLMRDRIAALNVVEAGLHFGAVVGVVFCLGQLDEIIEQAERERK